MKFAEYLQQYKSYLTDPEMGRTVKRKMRNNQTDLDHGLSENLNERLPLEPRRGEAGGNDSNNAATEFLGSTQISSSSDGRADGDPGDNPMNNPGLGTAEVPG